MTGIIRDLSRPSPTGSADPASRFQGSPACISPSEVALYCRPPIRSVPRPPFINFVSFAFISAFIVGHFVWLIERISNSAQFRTGYFEVIKIEQSIKNRSERRFLSIVVRGVYGVNDCLLGESARGRKGCGRYVVIRPRGTSRWTDDGRVQWRQ
jgi:hypothetical protein